MIEEPEILAVHEPDIPSQVESPPTRLAPPPKSGLRDYFEQALVTVIIALFLMTFIAQAVQVPTGSMQNNIHIGDHLFVNKFVFAQPTPILKWLLPAREIRRGDIIVFKFPENPTVSYVKRVVGLPGDKVSVRGTRVLVNDQELPEQRVTVRLLGTEYSSHPEIATEPAPAGARYRVYYDDHDHDLGESDLGSTTSFAIREPVIVPPNSYFALGDNRDNSLDSRYWGFVPRSNVIGRALYVYWSFNPRNPDSQGPENRLLRFFTQTNWRRTGTAIK
ncbi:MAG: signal peptidase I [Acidobacteriota bacterium]